MPLNILGIFTSLLYSASSIKTAGKNPLADRFLSDSRKLGKSDQSHN